MNLLKLNLGEQALITKVKGRGAFRKRIMEMGFVRGKIVKVIKRAPLGDPIEYNIMGYNVSLRASEAQLIEVETDYSNFKLDEYQSKKTIEDSTSKDNSQFTIHNSKSINVVFVGNPNSGKTTIFNYISGAKERVGNYGGVTIESKEGYYKHNGYKFNILDLPGTYSLTAYSPEELYVRNTLLNEPPDVVVNIIDATNIERNLYLTTQLIDMDIKVVVALNMFDEFERKGDQLDHDLLGQLIGTPIITTVGSKGIGLDKLFEKIIDVFEDRDNVARHIHINYGTDIEKSLNKVQNEIYKFDEKNLTNVISSRFLAIKLLEKDTETEHKLELTTGKEQIIKTAQAEIKRIENILNNDTESLFTDSRYGFIAGALKETFKPKAITKISRSDLIDKLLTHRFWGLPLFAFMMWLMFFVTFNLGEYPKRFLELLFNQLSLLSSSILPSGIINDLFSKGIINGVGGVIVFLPNIVLLFFFISLMEDTGYMSRAVFIMDRAMHKIGLHGKSFIPLLMGFGCNVPAILASRVIESKRDRLITILINPFMSCSARLPIYILFISAFFVRFQSLILFSIYIFGVIAGIITSVILGKTVYKNVDIPFVMELPPYRMPALKTLVRHLWFSTQLFLKKIGGVVLIATLIIWALGYFPRNTNNKTPVSNSQYPILNSQVSILNSKEHQRHEQSYIAQIGKFIEPVMRPLGFDWKMTVSLIAGLAAKEVVVGTLGILYQPDDSLAGRNVSLAQRLKQQQYKEGRLKGKNIFNSVVALSFIIFVLIYCPCIGVITAIRKETGNWLLPLFEILYTTALAWVLALIVTKIGTLFL